MIIDSPQSPIHESGIRYLVSHIPHRTSHIAQRVSRITYPIYCFFTRAGTGGDPPLHPTSHITLHAQRSTHHDLFKCLKTWQWTMNTEFSDRCKMIGFIPPVFCCSGITDDSYRSGLNRFKSQYIFNKMCFIKRLFIW